MKKPNERILPYNVLWLKLSGFASELPTMKTMEKNLILLSREKFLNYVAYTFVNSYIYNITKIY